MACLNSGVLVKLLEDMNVEDTASDDRKPSLLQIRSIVPVLSGGDLWPNQGFYLKVSDASHAMYVSLPHDQDDSVLCNKLHLGQFVYADRLESSYPVPLLIGVRPFPGRNSCTGSKKDLVSMDDLVEISGVSDPETVIKETDEKPREKVLSTCGSRNMAQKLSATRDPSPDYSRRIDRDSDTESTVSTCSTGSRISKRRIWNGADNARPDDIVEASAIRRRSKPIRCNPSASGSSGHLKHLKHDSLFDTPISKTMKKGKSLLMAKATKSPKKSNISATQRKTSSEVSGEYAAILSSLNSRPRTEDTILWASLPSSLLMLGKEVLKQRDAALLASVEALQEASAAERLLRCLSVYSELQAGSSEDQETKALVDQFFNLQDDLSQSRLVLNSLESTSHSKSSETDQEPNTDVGRLASERKKNAMLWIKAALASDLTPPASNRQTSDYDNSTKSTCSSRNLSNYKPKVRSGSSEGKLDWSRGSSICATSDLASSLQNESRVMFLGFLEQHLDGLRHRFSHQTNDQIVATMLQIKRVSDWIDKMAKKEAVCSKITCEREGAEFNPYMKVKNKIYRILLMHIEKTAVVWENMNGASLD
ncbi:hypothetical protein SAY87_008044 [Trapa incisa]|uniref:Uncharacterized protein n=1 Tax=Trapa incisa TaxID=236973 RepID=A0AAN7KP54_9MYRT|nr:hypothetical protein SAY87_008044 [Trapa incisa]